MGTLYLVRHGQASFGAADYDRLSELGERQCEALGAHWAARGLRFGAVLRGTLRRHVQSLAAIERGYGAPLPEALAWPGLDEYDGEAMLRAVLAGAPAPDTGGPDGYRQHFRLLRQGLLAWSEGRLQPDGMPRHADWVAGIVGALDHVQARHVGAAVLAVSSGGPIATAVAHVLAAPAASAIELNLRLRNSAVTEIAVAPRRLSLLTFNHLPHLDEPARADWITHS